LDIRRDQAARVSFRRREREEDMSDNTPDPVPPAGKPSIGIAWIWVAVIIALIVAVWLYFATKTPGAPGQPSARAALTAERTLA
jgi:cytochrome c-type biogenesis protein CcmH/NrfG